MRTNKEDQCNHEWEVDSGSGYNVVDMGINERRKRWDDMVKAGEQQYRSHAVLGYPDLRMECKHCNTGIWVVQYAVCDSNTGNPYVCDDCGQTEDDCYCEYCEVCDEETEDNCLCKEEE